jgi:hypothetical protein
MLLMLLLLLARTSERISDAVRHIHLPRYTGTNRVILRRPLGRVTTGIEFGGNHAEKRETGFLHSEPDAAVVETIPS